MEKASPKLPLLSKTTLPKANHPQFLGRACSNVWTIAEGPPLYGWPARRARAIPRWPLVIWPTQSTPRHLWYRLDAGDADIANFFHTDLELSVMLGSYLVIYHLWQGDSRKAWELIQRLDPWTQPPDFPPLVYILWRCALGLYHSVLGEFEACLQVVEEGLALARKTGLLLEFPAGGASGPRHPGGGKTGGSRRLDGRDGQRRAPATSTAASSNTCAPTPPASAGTGGGRRTTRTRAWPCWRRAYRFWGRIAGSLGKGFGRPGRASRLAATHQRRGPARTAVRPVPQTGRALRHTAGASRTLARRHRLLPTRHRTRTPGGSLYRRLMLCHVRPGQRAEALPVYLRSRLAPLHPQADLSITCGDPNHDHAKKDIRRPPSGNFP